jgi:hypothetical protein
MSASPTPSPDSPPTSPNTGTPRLHRQVITSLPNPHHSNPTPLSLFPLCRFGDDQLRALEAALSAGADVPAMLATRSSARRLLRAGAAEAFLQSSDGVMEDHASTCRSLSVADFFARAFALVGDVQVITLYSANRDQSTMAGGWGVAALCIYALPLLGFCRMSE